MAKKESSAGLFERAGYAYGASNLTMKHHDYTKSLGDSLDFSMKKSEEDKDKPKEEGTQDPLTVEYVLAKKEEIAGLMRIEEGKKNLDGVPYTKEDVEAASAKIDQLNESIVNHRQNIADDDNARLNANARLYTKNEDGVSVTNPNGISGGMTKEQQKNLVDFERGALPKRLNEETSQYEYLDYTTGVMPDGVAGGFSGSKLEYQYKPISEINMGSPTNPEFANAIEKNSLNIFKIAERRSIKNDPTEWDRIYKPQMLLDMKQRLKKKPGDAKNLIFTPEFEPVLDNLIFEGYFNKADGILKPSDTQDFEEYKNSVAYETAVNQIKNMKLDNNFFLDEYEEMIDKEFNATQTKFNADAHE